MLLRRAFLALGLAGLLAACTAPATGPVGTAPAPQQEQPPILFVHGNGDSAALWLTTLWRFESNGWPRDRLVALNMPYPLARDDDGKPQDGRSSAEDQMRTLAADVERIRARTGADKVVLVGNSRGGNAIRAYIQHGGGAATVSHAILGGTPNHGVWSSPTFRPHNEFNGAGPFLTGLNAPKGANGDEVTPGVHWMTLRSDHNDKFAQPTACGSARAAHRRTSPPKDRH
jgi:pimeloyl-ACP methyl ester carboxylesterase